MRTAFYDAAAPRRFHTAKTQDVLKSRTTEEWLARLEAEGVPCAPVLTRDQVIVHPQVLASGILMESDHEAVARICQTRAAARFSETPTTLRFGAPRLGEHNAEILAELGFERGDPIPTLLQLAL